MVPTPLASVFYRAAAGPTVYLLDPRNRTMVADMMSKSKMMSIAALLHDFVVGICLLFASGFVHELTVGALIRTTFYIPQALGLVVCLRGLVLLKFLLRPDVRQGAGMAALWGAQCVICAMTALALTGHQGHGVFVYALWSVVSVGFTSYFWILTRQSPYSAS